MQRHDMPRAPFTWAAFRALASASTNGTGPIPVDINRPALIVGCLPTISLTETGESVTPTLNDIVVSVTSAEGVVFTKQAGDGLANASGFVDLSALDTGEKRTLDLVITGPNELVIEARWKTPTLAAASYNDTLLGFNFWGNLLSLSEAEALREQLKKGVVEL